MSICIVKFSWMYFAYRIVHFTSEVASFSFYCISFPYYYIYTLLLLFLLRYTVRVTSSLWSSDFRAAFLKCDYEFHWLNLWFEGVFSRRTHKTWTYNRWKVSRGLQKSRLIKVWCETDSFRMRSIVDLLSLLSRSRHLIHSFHACDRTSIFSK